ncbi:hypothetical protein [Hymenobacter sediminis]|uniref:hypothetical protein n=1 Tax=Hymenobacter sediminis TaxID=2218621 RepID=UPI0013905404|nr:hypothetical protein [Hymenobacter sediminis]
MVQRGAEQAVRDAQPPGGHGPVVVGQEVAQVAVQHAGERLLAERAERGSGFG